jgi:hypothetical protein
MNVAQRRNDVGGYSEDYTIFPGNEVKIGTRNCQNKKEKFDNQQRE